MHYVSDSTQRRRLVISLMTALALLMLLLASTRATPAAQAASLDPIFGPVVPIDPIIPPISTPPEVTANSPEHNESSAPRDTVVWAAFNVAMDPSTIDESSFVVTQRIVAGFPFDIDGEEPVPGTVTYDPITRTAAFVPDDPFPPTNPDPFFAVWYKVTLTNAIKSSFGVSLNQMTWAFDVVDSFGAPNIIYVDPQDSETGVDPAADIWAMFDKEMDAGSLLSGFELERIGGSEVPASVTYDAVHRRARLNPSSDLQAGGQYRATLTATAETQKGTPLSSPYSWIFTVAPAPPAPEVVSTSPADNADDVAVETDVQATFDIALEPASLPGSFTLEAFGGGTVSGSLSYDAGTKTLIFDPASDLAFGTVYEATIDTSLESGAGTNLAAPVEWQFETVDAPPAPEVTLVSPASGANDVDVESTIRATFDLAMDANTLTTGTFTVEEVGGGTVMGSVTYNAGTKTAVFTPAGDLDFDTTYEVSLSTAVESSAATPLSSPHTWQFTTAATEAPVEPPTVSFPDVPASHPHHDAIIGLAGEGVVEGFLDGTFGPEKLVFRQQFAKMIVGALELPVAESMTQWTKFTDLGPDNTTSLYPHEFIASAVVNNITRGTTATTFSPWNNISRAQVITMVVRAVQDEHPGLLATPPASYTNTWGTGFSVDHGQNARIAEHNGLLDGLALTSTAADPWAAMPRGEVAQVLWNMMGMLP